MIINTTQQQAINKISFSEPRRELIATLACLFILISVAFVAIYQERPPAAVAASAAPEDFSSERAMNHLGLIADEARPIGSAKNAAVRAYILSEIERLGLKGEVQTATSVNSWAKGSQQIAGTVNNIIARLNGTGGGKAVLLVAHYDSVPGGPGANDDGTGVVVLLETLRALKASAPLKNDVVFLFSDGEEEGLLGAKAFMDEHPLAKSIGLVMNFEARGMSGPSIMFETSDNNGWLIDQFSKEAPYPVANSLTNGLYKMMSNDTDLSVFVKAGLPGLNFAYIEGSVGYHTEIDSAENVNRQSLQHHGSYALALARSFGNQDLADTRASNAIYFSLLRSVVIHYPMTLAKPLAILALVMFGGLLVAGFRRKVLTIRGAGYAIAGFLLSQVIALLVVGVIWRGMLALRHNDDIAASGIIYSSNLFIIGFIAIALAIMLGLYGRFRRSKSAAELATWALLLWVILSLATSFVLPGASYLFTWPALSSTLALGYLFVKRVRPGSAKEKIILSIGASPAVLLLAPVIYMVFVALTLRLYVVIMVMAGLLIGLIVPQLTLTLPVGKWLQPGLTALLGLTLVFTGVATSGFDLERRKPNNLSYLLDADAGKAIWLSSDQMADEYTSQFLGTGVERVDGVEYLPASRRKLLKSDAPVASLSAPDVTLVSSQGPGEGRTLRFRITSPRKASCIWIAVDDQGQISSATINNKPVNIPASGPEPRAPFRIGYYGAGQNGIELTLITRSPEPVKLTVMDSSYGPFGLPGVPIKPRPDYMMAAGYPNSDSTVVRKTYTF